jgi:hypothetical protein
MINLHFCGLFAALTFVSSPLLAQSIEGTSYMLPKNGMRFTVKVEKTQYKPGEFSPYAERFMREKVSQQPSTTYRIIGIEMDQTAVPDTSKQFKLTVDKKYTIDKVSLTHDGQLLAINTDAKQPTLPVRVFKPAPKPAPLDPSAFMTEDILSAGSTAKQAELTAKEIYDIRDSRNSLSRGDADNLPKDGAQLKLMYENMNRQEAALTQLFEGTTVKDTTWTQLSFVPVKEGKSVLFRFSKYYGLVSCDDLSGEPYFITITDEHTAKDPMADAATEKKKEDKNDIGLRSVLPSKIKAVLTTGGKTVATYEMNAAQFGFVQSLSGDLFGKKQSAQIVFDPLTGSVRSIKDIEMK